MEFVDTNYFLRYLLKDNKEQGDVAYSLFKEAILGKVKLFTSIIVFFEIYWLLSSFYSKKKDELINILSAILEMNFIRLDEGDLLKQAIQMYGTTNLDLEDSYNLVFAKHKKAMEFNTFDKKLKREFFKSEVSR